MDFLGRVIYRGNSGSQINKHFYLIIAYTDKSNTYLVVNFTTKKDKLPPKYTVSVNKCEFPEILTSNISEIAYSDAEEMTAKDIQNTGILTDSYNKDIICPNALLDKIISKIKTKTSSLKVKFIKKYFPEVYEI